MSEQPIVLVVDDDIEVAELTCEVAELGGVKAVYRTNVVDAIDFLARHAGPIAGVITDVDLASPLSGIELACHVDVEWPGIAVCVISGVSVTRPIRLPASADFISKPWRSVELLAFIDKALGR